MVLAIQVDQVSAYAFIDKEYEGDPQMAAAVRQVRPVIDGMVTLAFDHTDDERKALTFLDEASRLLGTSFRTRRVIPYDAATALAENRKLAELTAMDPAAYSDSERKAVDFLNRISLT